MVLQTYLKKGGSMQVDLSIEQIMQASADTICTGDVLCGSNFTTCFS